ncbi:MAG: sulfatase family protein [Verrucomicrobiales bacterium]
MKTRLLLLVCIILSASAFSADRPNSVIVLADDMGWGDPQCYQADSKIPTPAIDRLAAEGLKFSDVHTPSSVCTPTRYTLLTGRYTWRTRLKSHVLDGFDPPLIGEGEDTIATLLKRVGYKTHCIGKWHLGAEWTRKDGSKMPNRDMASGFRQGLDIDFTKPFQGGPIDVGFDSYFGISASLDMSLYCYLRGNRVVSIPETPTEKKRDGVLMNQVAGVTSPGFKLDEVLPKIGAEAAKIIRESKDDPTPFFCYIPLTSPHLPVVPTPDSIGKSGAGPYGDFVVATDNALGEILDALDETDQTKDTFVLFTSDNGGLFDYWDFRASDDGGKAPKAKRGEQNRKFNHQSNADWRGTNADIFEGGHRVPFLIRWPGKAAAGDVIDTTIELTDTFATIAEIVGEKGEGTSGTDSFSILSLIKNTQPKSSRPFAIHHSLFGMFAIRKGDWKLVEGRGSGGFTRPRTLDAKGIGGQHYNLKDDPRKPRVDSAMSRRS